VEQLRHPWPSRRGVHCGNFYVRLYQFSSLQAGARDHPVVSMCPKTYRRKFPPLCFNRVGSFTARYLQLRNRVAIAPRFKRLNSNAVKNLATNQFVFETVARLGKRDMTYVLVLIFACGWADGGWPESVQITGSFLRMSSVKRQGRSGFRLRQIQWERWQVFSARPPFEIQPPPIQRSLRCAR
jgi:hypothetical protein